MEEEVATIFEIWKKRSQHYYQYGRRGCKNILNIKEEVATIFKIWKKRLQEYFKYKRRGCKNI